MTDVQLHQTGNVLHIAGEMTIYQSSLLKEQLTALCTSAQIHELDLSEVTELDSSGFQLIALARREVQVRGHTLTVKRCSACVRQVFETYGVVDWVRAKPAKKSGRKAVK